METELHMVQRALDSEQKAHYVNQMFGRIARRYDLMNRLMTAGRDQTWRRQAARMACIPRQGRVLDLATGTGDLALALLDVAPTATVVGMDFSLSMMAVGLQKPRVMQATRTERLHLAAGDALELPFPDDTFDAVLSAFLMRNVTDVEQSFREQCRVLRPAGRLVCLEITMPTTPGFRRLFSWYFGHLVPLIGGLISGSREAYTYLPESVRRFPQPDVLVAMLRRLGFSAVWYRRLAMGTVAIHVAIKARP